MNLRNKVAVLTGGARMGEDLSRALAAKGCHVVLGYRHSKQSAQKAIQNLDRIGIRSAAYPVDLTRSSSIDKFIRSVVRTFGAIDILINMASVYEKTPWLNLSEKKWDQNIAANLKGFYLMVNGAAPLLKKRGGRVINFSDWICASGRPRYKGFVPYYTSKMGVLGLSQAQALELAPQVLVNVIAPGPILPPRTMTSRERREVEKVTPLGKWGGVQEIVKAVLFLCETDFVTGECLRVDGGRHLY